MSGRGNRARRRGSVLPGRLGGRSHVKDDASLRLFVGVPLAAPVSTRLVRWMAGGRQERPQLKWVEPQNLHLTLRFLGERPAGDVDVIRAAVGRVLNGRRAFTIAVQGVGGFPSLERARTVWAGVGSGTGELAELARVLERALLDSLPGLPPAEHAFRAHITLARARTGYVDGTRWTYVAAARDRLWGTMEVDRVVLYRSQLYPGGPVYTPLATWRLAVDGSPEER